MTKKGEGGLGAWHPKIPANEASAVGKGGERIRKKGKNRRNMTTMWQGLVYLGAI